MTKHREKRDLPHARHRGPGEQRKHGEAAAPFCRPGGDHAHAAGRAPKRPAFFMFVEDVGDAPDGIYGMYPKAFIPWVLPWLGCARADVLHVCSGALPPGEGIRVDLRPEARPDILADGRAMPLADGSVAAVLIDPPYSPAYARELYGVEYPRPAHLLREAVRVVRAGGRVGIVHYIVPNPPQGARFIKAFGLSTGFGYPMRAVTIYEKTQPTLPFVGERDA